MLIIVIALIGIVLVSLYVSALNSFISFNKQEFISYIEIKKNNESYYLKKHSAVIIKVLFYMKKYQTNKNAKKFILAGLYLKNVCNRNVMGNNRDKYFSPSEIIINMEKRIDKDIAYVKDQFSDVPCIGKKLDKLMTEQKTIENSLSEALNQQVTIFKELMDSKLPTDLRKK